MGESLDTTHSWDRGEQPAILPHIDIVGTDRCIQDGELIRNGVQPPLIRNGFVLRCFVPHIDTDPDWPAASTWESCSLQFFYATVIAWMYAAQVGDIERAFRLLLTGPFTFKWHPGAGLIPDIVTVIAPGFSIVVIDGTQNFQQLATQAFQGATGPTNRGIYSTEPLWYSTATQVIRTLVFDGYNADKPLMVVGHSYGGAVAANVAARIGAADITRLIRLLTFGDPKPGDGRLAKWLTIAQSISLVNDNDLVGALPPDFLTLLPVLAVIPDPHFRSWQLWIREPNRARQAGDGILTYNVDPLLNFAALFTMANQIILGQPLNVIPGHFIEEYRNRIRRRCPVPEWPVGPVLWQWLLNPIGAIGLAGRSIHAEPIGNIGFGSPAGEPIGDIGLGAPPVELLGDIGLGAPPVELLGDIGLGAPPDIAEGDVGLMDAPDVDFLVLGAPPDTAEGGVGLGDPPGEPIGNVGLGAPPDTAEGGVGLGDPPGEPIGNVGLGAPPDTAEGGVGLFEEDADYVVLGDIPDTAEGGVGLGDVPDTAEGGVGLTTTVPPPDSPLGGIGLDPTTGGGGGGVSYNGSTTGLVAHIDLDFPGPWPGIFIGMTCSGPGVVPGSLVTGIRGFGDIIDLDNVTSFGVGLYVFT